MAGKRIQPDGRAHHGPEEDRMKKPQGDRSAKRGLRFRERSGNGLSAKDEARRKAWEQT